MARKKTQSLPDDGAGPAPHRKRRGRRSPPDAAGRNGTGAGPAPAVPPPPPDLPWYTGADLPTREIRWLLPGYLPAGVPTLLYGPSKRGKSTVARALAAMVTTGRRLPAMRPGTPAPVIWFGSEEDTRAVIGPRLAAAGADMDLVHFPGELRDGTMRRLRVLDHGRELQAVVERCGAGLVVFDPVRAYCGGQSSPDSGETATGVLQALTDLGQLTGCACLVVKQPRKSGRGGADEQISGSMEWFNCARQILLNTPHPTRPGESALIPQGVSLGPQPPSLTWQLLTVSGLPVLDWLGTCDLTAQQAQSGGLPEEEEEATEDAVAFLRARLEAGPQTVPDLTRWANEAGLSIHQLRRARRKLRVTFFQEGGNDKRVYLWRAPEGGWQK